MALGRRDFSLVDCTSIEVMRKLGHEVIFAFDHHFTDQGLTQAP